MPNYKVYASIQQLLDFSRKKTQPKNINEQIMLEETILEHLLNNMELKRAQTKGLKHPHIDNLTNKLVQNRFNEKYDKEFSPGQKKLLKYFINNSKDFDSHAQSEMQRVDQVLSDAIDNYNDDPVLQIRLKDAKQLLSESVFLDPTEDNLASLLIYIDLAENLQEEMSNAS